MLNFFYTLLLLLPLSAFAGDHQVKLQISNLPENAQPILLRMYNGNLFPVDTLGTKNQETLTFNIPANTPSGMLRCVLGLPAYAQYTMAQPVNLDILFNQEDIEIKLDFQQPVNSAQVIRSEENRIYFSFLQEDARIVKKLGLLEQVVLNYPDQDDYFSKTLEYYSKFQQQRNKLIDKIYASHPRTLAGRIIRNQKIPFTDRPLSPRERDSLFRTDFLKLIDFTDTTLLHTNVYTDKIFQYIQMHMERDAGLRKNEANCITALDRIVPHLDSNPTVQQHLLQFLIAGFESMNMEEVLAHISARYLQQCGSSSGLIRRRLEGYSKMAVGKSVPDFTVTDINGNPVNLYSNLQPYTLILFWHTGCSHCQLLLQQLPALEREGLFSKYQVSIIGISIDETKAEWEKFSEGYPLKWTNAHTEGSFESPVATDYNLFATPSMFLIDANHNILAKPTTIRELEENIRNL